MLDLGLGGKVAIVTGGSEGLGRAAAQKLAAEGARVAICARRPDVLERAAAGASSTSPTSAPRRRPRAGCRPASPARPGST